jgi:hypothetical protein
MSVPRLEHGYCTDDVGRALAVVVREPFASPQLDRLADTYLAFLERAQLPDGRFHNRAAHPDGAWLDDVGSDDSNGRALFGLGYAVGSQRGFFARRALACFEAGARGFSSPAPRANAWAAIGAAEVHAIEPGNAAAIALLEQTRARLGRLGPDPAWPWPESRLAYDNARLAEARIAAGVALGDQPLAEEGLFLLNWLVEIELAGDRFSFAPAGGWASGEPRPGFDQQPLEAGSMGEACARAYDATADTRWVGLAVIAAAWFLGRNVGSIPLLDARSGGGCDGLTRRGRNENQGAESTLALISASQQARRLQAAARKARRSPSADTCAPPTHRSAAPYVV